MTTRTSTLGFLGMIVAVCLAATVGNAQYLIPQPEMPRNVAGGIEFRIKAPSATGAFVAGDFNSWGDASEGEIVNEDARMAGPDANGYFSKVYSLTPGTYKFQYVLEDRWSDWLHVPSDRMPVDESGNNILVVRPDGTVVPAGYPYVFAPKNTPGGIEFRVYAPGYRMAYVAGSFNNWANHVNGQIRDGRYQMFVAPDHEFVRTIPIKQGVYQYMINLDGRADRWLEGSSELPRDSSGHRYFTVTRSGLIAETADLAILPPRVTSDGMVEFRVYAPKTQSVYVAGSFNEWANNDQGTVTDADALMIPDANGMFSKKIELEPGKYSFKYVLNGAADSWMSLDPNDLPRDLDSNSVFTLTEDNTILEMEGKPDPWTEFGLAAARAQQSSTGGQAVASAQSAGEALIESELQNEFSAQLAKTIGTTGKPRILFFYHPKAQSSIDARKWLEGPEGRALQSAAEVLSTDVSEQRATAQRYGVFRVPAAVLLGQGGAAEEVVVYSGNQKDFTEKMTELAGVPIPQAREGANNPFLE
ncbi:glycogen-binding domain-containing protein [bacterium]|nr:glycogen-binding domain-containing protein [bacterium]